MLVIYAHPNCRNIGKICNFLDANAICYERIDLVKSAVTKELVHAWSIAFDDGLFGLIQEFKIPKQHKEALYDGQFSVFLGFLCTHPFVFKSPIMYDGKKICVGGNIESCRIFLRANERTQI